MELWEAGTVAEPPVSGVPGCDGRVSDKAPTARPGLPGVGLGPVPSLPCLFSLGTGRAGACLRWLPAAQEEAGGLASHRQGRGSPACVQGQTHELVTGFDSGLDQRRWRAGWREDPAQ